MLYLAQGEVNSCFFLFGTVGTRIALLDLAFLFPSSYRAPSTSSTQQTLSSYSAKAGTAPQTLSQLSYSNQGMGLWHGNFWLLYPVSQCHWLCIHLSNILGQSFIHDLPSWQMPAPDPKRMTVSIEFLPNKRAHGTSKDKYSAKLALVTCGPRSSVMRPNSYCTDGRVLKKEYFPCRWLGSPAKCIHFQLARGTEMHWHLDIRYLVAYYAWHHYDVLWNARTNVRTLAFSARGKCSDGALIPENCEHNEK